MTRLARSTLHLLTPLACLLVATGAWAQTPGEAGAPTETAGLEGATPEAPADSRSALTALYPLWENTAHLLGHGRLFVGTSAVELGLLDVAQVGLRPVSFLFRTPNVHAKVRLLHTQRLSVAAHAEVLVFLPGSSEAFTSSNYVSRLDTRDTPLLAVPVGATASWAVTPWLFLHGTATVMATPDNGTYQGRAVPGASLVAELLAYQHHTLTAHVGEVGLWDHDFTVVGAGYRFRQEWFEVQVGYFYRLMPDGAQGSPLLSLGAYL